MNRRDSTVNVLKIRNSDCSQGLRVEGLGTMSPDPPDDLGEERRRKVRKKRRVTKVMVDGKEVTGDFLKNPKSLEFPDPGRGSRKWIILAVILIGVALSAVLFIKISDFMPDESSGPPIMGK